MAFCPRSSHTSHTDGKLPNGLRNKSPGMILTLTRSGKASESAGGGYNVNLLSSCRVSQVHNVTFLIVSGALVLSLSQIVDSKNKMLDKKIKIVTGFLNLYINSTTFK